MSAVPERLPLATPTGSGWSQFWVASVAVFLVSVDGTVLFAAFGALRHSFPTVSAADLSWVLNAYTVVYAALLVPAGGLADRFGRKRVFLVGVATFLAASVACGLAANVTQLVLARILQAAGAAALTPASLALVLAAFPLSQRAIVVSAWGAVGALAAAMGPGLGALIVDHLGWPWAFYLNLPVGLISIWLGRRILVESRPEDSERAIDLVGAGLLIVGVGAIALTTVQIESPAWSGLELTIAALSGIAALTAFCAWIVKAKRPLVEPALFRNRTYRYANLAMLTFGIAFAMMFFTFFIFLTSVYHLDLPQAGLSITPGPLTVIPTAIITGRLAAKHGHRPFLLIGSLVYASSGLWFLLVPGDEPRYLTEWLPGLVLSGIGVGMVMPSISGAAVAHLPAAHYGVGSAFNQAVRQIGGVLGVALTILLIGSDLLTRADFTPIYTTHIGLALLTGLLCSAIQTRPATRAIDIDSSERSLATLK
jgi:EmrB/QacA subfamily drug resistance transporter